jgi:tetratricopeptide (TPR) repeat protein
MTCTTCHDPHTSSLEKDAAWWDGKCLQCHDRTACTETKAHRDAAGDHCTPCHMRSGTTSNVPLVAVTDHWIQKRPPPIKPGPTEPPRSLVAWSTHLGEPVADGGASALAHADAGLTDEATRLAIATIAKQPTAQLWDFLANAYLARRHTREAGLAYRAALNLDPDDTGALFGYARVMLDAKQPAEAQQAFDRMLQLDPDDVAALETLGIDRYRSGERARAVELFRRAANTGRASGIAYVGLALDARGDAKQELAWLEKAWRAEPRDRWILDELDAVSGVLGDPKLSAEISHRRAAITPVAGSAASAWIPVQNRRQ